MSEHFY